MAEKIVRSDWVSNFSLVGKPAISDYTFEIDVQSNKSSWVYNKMRLGVDCGEKHGKIYIEMMGGYSPDKESVIYVHGKKDNGDDDFNNRFEVAWEDRFDEDILESVGRSCFIRVGLEKTDKGKIFEERFLSEYDAIEYIKKNMTNDMVIYAKGNLGYSTYKDETTVRKNAKTILLSDVDDSSKYYARFTQSILLDKDSTSQKNIDKDKGVMYVDARVLDYVKEYNGIEVRSQFPFNIQFEFQMPLDDQNKCKKIMDNVFKVKKGITQETFEGDFIESGATVTATIEDIPDEIKVLIDSGVWEEEDALKVCSSNESSERRMVLRRPLIKKVGEDKVPVLQKFEDRYVEDDLILDCITKGNDNQAPWDEDDSSNEDDSWMDELDNLFN